LTNIVAEIFRTSKSTSVISAKQTYGKDDNFGPEKKNVKVVGMGVCIPLRVTEVTILALKKKM
jgi:hypothetical protein